MEEAGTAVEALLGEDPPNAKGGVAEDEEVVPGSSKTRTAARSRYA